MIPRHNGVFFKYLFNFQGGVFGVVEGGASVEMRARSAAETAKRPVAGTRSFYSSILKFVH